MTEYGTWVSYGGAARIVLAVVLVAAAARQEHLFHPAPADPITPVTLIGVGAIFAIIAISSSHGGQVMLASAVIGALAAPMIFEFPAPFLPAFVPR